MEIDIQLTKPLINIITRTRNRPNHFNICVQSLTQQGDVNLHHIVTYQVDEDLEYINKYKYPNTTLVKVPNIIKDPHRHTYIDGNHLNHSPYNTFLNEAHKHVKEGWIMYLDDDDFFLYKNSIEVLYKNIFNYDLNTKHFWRVKFPTYLLPNDHWWQSYVEGKPLKISQISMIGMLYHSNHLDKINFHEWACGDYFAFSNLDKLLPKRNMINSPLTGLQSSPGNGLRKDLQVR